MAAQVHGASRQRRQEGPGVAWARRSLDLIVQLRRRNPGPEIERIMSLFQHFTSFAP
jgi:hypothetical protein